MQRVFRLIHQQGFYFFKEPRSQVTFAAYGHDDNAALMFEPLVALYYYYYYYYSYCYCYCYYYYYYYYHY